VWAQEKSHKKKFFFCGKCLDSVNGARVQWGIPRGYPPPPPGGGGGGGEQIPCQGGWHGSCCDPVLLQGRRLFSYLRTYRSTYRENVLLSYLLTVVLT
jgi:hypothetical protein